MVIWLLDISNHQGNFNVAQAAAEGYSAIIGKATEGRTFKDGRFDANIAAIQNAGLVPGAYHFLRKGSGTTQAQVFHQRIAAHGGPDGWLMACDNEADATLDDTRAFVAAQARTET